MGGSVSSESFYLVLLKDYPLLSPVSDASLPKMFIVIILGAFLIFTDLQTVLFSYCSSLQSVIRCSYILVQYWLQQLFQIFQHVSHANSFLIPGTFGSDIIKHS